MFRIAASQKFSLLPKTGGLCYWLQSEGSARKSRCLQTHRVDSAGAHRKGEKDLLHVEKGAPCRRKPSSLGASCVLSIESIIFPEGQSGTPQA